LGSEIGRGKRGWGRCAIAQQGRLGVVIEANADSHARPARPRFRRQLSPDARGRNSLSKLVVRPPGSGLILLPPAAALLGDCWNSGQDAGQRQREGRETSGVSYRHCSFSKNEDLRLSLSAAPDGAL